MTSKAERYHGALLKVPGPQTPPPRPWMQGGLEHSFLPMLLPMEINLFCGAYRAWDGQCDPVTEVVCKERLASWKEFVPKTVPDIYKQHFKYKSNYQDGFLTLRQGGTALGRVGYW
jgi:hypothetical protein